MLTTDQRRGAELSALALRTELVARGHESTTVALTASNHLPRLDEVPVLAPQGHRLGVRALGGLRRAGSSVDVVLAHGSSTLPASALALSGSGTPFVYANIGDPLYWASSFHKRARVRAALRRASGVAARSAAAQDVLVNVFGVPADRVVVIGNGRDVSRFTPGDRSRRMQARRGLGLPMDAPIAVAVGAVAPEKRLDIAVRAIAALPHWHLIIAGDGPLRQAVTALAAGSAPGRVHLLGQVADVTQVFAAADVALLTSDSEGLPGALVEAGLSGLPAVATNAGYVADVVLDGRTGRLVQLGAFEQVSAALVEALARPDWGLAAAEHCRESFDMQQVAVRWEALLRRAVEVPR